MKDTIKNMALWAIIVPLFIAVLLVIVGGAMWLGIWLIGDKDLGVLATMFVLLSLIGAFIGWLEK